MPPIRTDALVDHDHLTRLTHSCVDDVPRADAALVPRSLRAALEHTANLGPRAQRAALADG